MAHPDRLVFLNVLFIIEKSVVWKHFEKLDKTEARCKLCRRSLTFHNGSTGVLFRHLRNAHSEVVEDLEARAKKTSQVESQEEEARKEKEKQETMFLNQFKFADHERAECTLCHQIIVYQGSTAVLRDHSDNHCSGKALADNLNSSK